MAKMKLSEVGPDGQSTETMTIEISERQIKQLRIGQRVEVTLKGSIGMLEVPPDGVTPDDPPLLGLLISSKKVVPENAFAQLAADDGEE